MGTLIYCDMEGCSSTGDECKMYKIDINNKKSKGIKLSNSYFDICKDCVDSLNKKYIDKNGNRKFIEDDIGVITINRCYEQKG